jgi:hypothetical protein
MKMRSVEIGVSYVIPTERFSRCIAASKKVRWDIESDGIRGRRFHRANKFLPDGLTLAHQLDFLSSDFGLDRTIAAGYQELRTRVVVKGDGTEEQFRQIHERVLATPPNFYNVTRAIQVAPTMIIE